MIINISQTRLTLLVAAIAQLIMQIIANMTIVALPDISSNLNFSAETLLWINLIYLMSFVAFSLPFSKVISQYGIKKCTKISLFILLASVLISAFSINDFMFLLSRLLQGFTSASLAISLYVMIVEEFEDHTLGSALGIVSSAGYLGMLIAPSFMGFMIYLFEWRVAFLILIPLIAILLVLLNKIDNEWIIGKRPVDNKGSLIYIVLMIAFTYGMTILDDIGIVFIIISFILLAIFIKIERNYPEPIFNFKLIRNVKYVIGNYAAMATYFTTTIAITSLSLHLQYILNTEEVIVGLILIISPIIMIGMSGFSGWLSNRIDPRLLSGVAMIFICISSIIFFFIDFIPFHIILVACVLQGTGNGLFSAPNNKYVLTLVEEKDLPDASSVLSTSKEFGKILSSGIFTLILSIFIGNQELGPERLDYSLIQSTNLMMFICILVTFSAAILIFYSKYQYKFAPNENTIRFFKHITPKWAKK